MAKKTQIIIIKNKNCIASKELKEYMNGVNHKMKRFNIIPIKSQIKRITLVGLNVVNY